MPCIFMSFFISFITPAFSIFHVIWQWSWVCTISWVAELSIYTFAFIFLYIIILTTTNFLRLWYFFSCCTIFIIILHFFLKSHILSAAARLLFSIEFTVFFKLIPMGMFNISIYFFPVFLMTTTLPLHPPFTRDYIQ